MPNKALDRFGEILIESVRDKSVEEWGSILGRKLKGERATRIYNLLDMLPEADQAQMMSLIPEVVDTVLHRLLWTLEQSDDLRIAARADDEDVDNLNDVSDGMAGELHSDQGWIARFSRYTKKS